MSHPCDKFFAITGPEGAGKTTLIAELSKRGLATVPESTRDVWRYQARIGGPNVVFLGGTAEQKRAYFEMALALDMRMHDDAAHLSGPVFFDRAMPDLAVFMDFFTVPMPEHIHRGITMHRYNPVTFLAPFWPEIYAHDPERLSSPEEAASQEQICRDAYARYGYEVVTLPLASPEERADFVQQFVARVLKKQ